jgi:hypothetical protein
MRTSVGIIESVVVLRDLPLDHTATYKAVFALLEGSQFQSLENLMCLMRKKRK